MLHVCRTLEELRAGSVPEVCMSEPNWRRGSRRRRTAGVGSIATRSNQMSASLEIVTQMAKAEPRAEKHPLPLMEELQEMNSDGIRQHKRAK